jgi:uncharacterized protein involved in exopolysaccharide biosynthesis
MERTYTFDELLVALRRRWKRAALVAGVAFALAALIIARLSNQYTARALVMVEALHPHPDLVTPVLASLEERVKSVRAQVYARGLLATAVDELHLYPKEREKGGLDAAIEALRLDLEVRPEGDTAFAITVRSEDPAQAADVANRLAELFIEGNLQVRAGQVARTREAISSKLAEMQAMLEKSDVKVNEFKEAHAGALPELLESMNHEREVIAKAMEVETGFVQEARRRLDLLGTQPFGKDTEVGRLEDEEGQLTARASLLASSLNADHPDVLRLRREASDVHERLQQARARAAANNLEQKRMEAAVERGQQNLGTLQKRMDALDQRYAQVPANGARLAELTRDSDVLRAKVQHLVSKKAEAEVTAELEHRQAASEFRVLESAAMATLPSSPNRPQALLIALLVALGLGIALAVAEEMSDRTLRSEAEAGSALSLPVLASVPRLTDVRASGAVLALPPVRD